MAYNILDIEKDLVDDSQPIIRKEIFFFGDKQDNTVEHDMEIITSIPHQLWSKISGMGAGYR